MLRDAGNLRNGEKSRKLLHYSLTANGTPKAVYLF